MKSIPAERTRRGVLTALALAAALAGCATDPLTAIGIPPLRPSPAAGSTRPGGPVPAAGPGAAATPSEVCRDDTYVVPLDVDTAYARVMSQLQFRTVAERQHFAARYSHGLIDNGFRHVAQPNTYYRMADLVSLNRPDAPQQAAEWLRMELSREGPSSTRVKAGYCLGSRHSRFNDPAYDAYLQRVMREVLTR